MTQRIIKFRQWNQKHKRMYYDSNFPFDSNKTSINKQIELSQGIGTVWMQFTGLLDKRGREIYEGDIVKYFDKNYEVYWIYGHFMACNELWIDKGLEVIGNVWENGELL